MANNTSIKRVNVHLTRPPLKTLIQLYVMSNAIIASSGNIILKLLRLFRRDSRSSLT